ncbi:hypothetical protein B0H66DRAFT_347658 [Apodospora peruviana]|uniref:Nephrocystin 3-like N-terminal domain-containing protein n=1 Tax=Apodospora peruviana TaxID=516989 RepID=A0AAE0M2K0_9PEZI|nr:hypothetical protein B0H66DRAFT_347658 [Apodospora peruviana]
MLEVNRYVEDISDNVKEVQNLQISDHEDSLYKEIKAWLGAQDDNNMNSGRYEQNLVDRHAGSGEWLFSHASFQQWLDTSNKGMQSNLWLKGPPGTGKSFLCSTAIDKVSNRQPNDACCLYYFHRFDDQSGAGSDGGTGTRAAALLVDQLFHHFWRLDKRVATPVSTYIMTVQKTVKSITAVARLILKHGHQHAAPNTEPVHLFVFLDGLDENKDAQSRGTREIMGMFDGFEAEVPMILRVWISSRPTNFLNKCLENWPVISVEEGSKTDVEEFLKSALQELQNDEDMVDWTQEIEEKPLHDWVLSKLQTRAKGNFLFARLMVSQLKDVAITVDDIIEFVKSSLPTDLTQIYGRIFDQYQLAQHKYLSLLFSLLAFARRPLHYDEIREAMTLALSDPSKGGLDPRKVPNIKGMFAPLIETQIDPNEPGNPLCRLCHSTVQEFLTTNPGVLRIQISPSKVGDLCLRYLSQERYSKLWELPSGDQHEPLTLFSDDVVNTQHHAFLPYCAKYWDRHLEDLNPTPELYRSVCEFLKSPNFQTLIQAQSLFVTHQFTFLKTLMYRRVFPRWFAQDPQNAKDPKLSEQFGHEGYKRAIEYRHFMYEWGYLLERATCLNATPGKCFDEHFRGEVDRCLSGLLGPTHFMNGMKERYPSFMLTHEPFEYDKSTQSVIAEAVFSDVFQFMIVSSPSRDSSDVRFDVWDLSQSEPPRLVSTRLNPTTSKDLISNVPVSNEAAGAFMLGNNLKLLLDRRAGRDILNDFVVQKHGAEGGEDQDKFEPLSTDFASRGEIVVVGSRNVHKKRRKNTAAAAAKAKPSKIIDPGDSDSDNSSGDESDHDDDDADGYSSEDNSAYETCSEGSTDFESDESSASDCESIDDDNDESDNDDGDESDADKDFSDSSDESSEDETKAKPKQTKRDALVLTTRPEEDEEEGDFSLKGEESISTTTTTSRPTWPGQPNRLRDKRDRITSSVAVYKVISGTKVRLFHYEHDIPAMLYHSPPALHPHAALLVWPLGGGGEVLFADFEEKTYFVRAMMPTTRNTRHICMKVRFSPCGRYVHIASVEARLVINTTASRQKKKATLDDKEIVVSLFVTTHRLSVHKTTRSPPRLVHKVKLALGQFSGLSLARLPFTFTWTDEYLHFTVSGTRLSIFRVGLFRSAGGAPVVTAPTLSVMLPLSASNREVHYLPPPSPGTKGGRGVVLLGSYDKGNRHVSLSHRKGSLEVILRAMRRGMGDMDGKKELMWYACPPAVIFVDEDKDLGGWKPLVVADEDKDEESSMGIVAGTSTDRLRDGRLTRRIEAFNWQDDMDLEGICENCHAPISTAD